MNELFKIMSEHPENKYFSNSRLSAFKKCPRYFFLYYHMKWTKDISRSPLYFGSAWHAGMDAIWSGIANGQSRNEVVEPAQKAFIKTWVEEGGPAPDELPPDITDKRTIFRGIEMLEEYARVHESWLRTIKLLAVERAFVIPLFSLSQYQGLGNGSASYVGILDKVFEQGGRISIGEHKTTALYKKGGPFQDNWLHSFIPNNQIYGYGFAGMMNFGKKFYDILVDASLIHKTEFGFRRIPVVLTARTLEVWLTELQAWCNEIIQREIVAQNDPELVPQCFPKNDNSCNMYGRCGYSDICTYYDANPTHISEVPQGYTMKESSPIDTVAEVVTND